MLNKLTISFLLLEHAGENLEALWAYIFVKISSLL